MTSSSFGSKRPTREELAAIKPDCFLVDANGLTYKVAEASYKSYPYGAQTKLRLSSYGTVEDGFVPCDIRVTLYDRTGNRYRLHQG